MDSLKGSSPFERHTKHKVCMTEQSLLSWFSLQGVWLKSCVQQFRWAALTTVSVRLSESGRDYANTAGPPFKHVRNNSVKEGCFIKERHSRKQTAGGVLVCASVSRWQKALFLVGTSGTLIRDSRWRNAIDGSLSAPSLNNRKERKKKKNSTGNTNIWCNTVFENKLGIRPFALTNRRSFFETKCCCLIFSFRPGEHLAEVVYIFCLSFALD